MAMPNLSGAAILHNRAMLPCVNAAAFSEKMSGIAERQGARLIDLTPEIRKAASITDAFYPVDGHPSGAAHAIIAEAVASYFERNGAAALRPSLNVSADKRTNGQSRF